MSRVIPCVIFLVLTLFLSNSAQSHFGMVIPSKNVVSQEQKNLQVSLSFSHPFEGVGMDLDKPEKFYLLEDGKKRDLVGSLKKSEIMKHVGWQADLKIKRPGVYQFVMEPSPYWEAAEDIFIIHYTKTIVAAFGEDEGWDKPVGLPAEIVPLLRPYGNYAGNTFTGKVLIDGKAAANMDVEIEIYNEAGELKSPSEYHITQVVKTDARGIFSFTCPQSGWWGFSALSEAKYTLPGPDQKEKNVEQAGVIWVYFDKFSRTDKS